MKEISAIDAAKRVRVPIVINQSAGAHNDKKKQQNKDQCRKSKSGDFQKALKDAMYH